MPRSVNHVASRAKRKRILKLTRGYYGARKNVWTVAKNTWEKGLTYAFRDRRNKKRNFRALWIQRINAAARLEGMSYSRLMGALHAAGIEMNRKVLADLAVNHPEAFKAIVLSSGVCSYHGAAFFKYKREILMKVSLFLC
jgi:large subunit ribosomal protein L20